MATVLVTCVGSGVGQSVLDSLNLNRNHKIIGCDGNRNVYAHSYCDKFYIVPSIFADNYFDVILEIAKENKVEIIVPGNDQELLMLSKQREKFENEGIQVLVSEPEVINVSRDKQEWFNYFNEYGCKIVPTYSVAEFKENPDESLLPAIVKPVGGSASQGISIINNLEDLQFTLDEDIIQPYLFPESNDPNYNAIINAVKNGKLIQKSEISIQLIFNKDAKFSGIFISKNSLKDGVPVFVEPLNPKEFQYLDEIMKFVPVLESKKVIGPVNIQGRVTAKGLYFFEMNMRFTGITGNRALLGFNEVEYLVNNFLGKDSHGVDSYAINKLGVRQVACSVIPKAVDSQFPKVITLLGAGSEVGKYFIEKHYTKYTKIFVISREDAFQRYQENFNKYNNVVIVRENDVRANEFLCQSDVFVNFVSALAYEEDSKKFSAVQYVYQWTTKVAKARIPFILNLSSQSVYPQNVNVKKDETHEVTQKSAYAFQKLLIEEFMQSIKEFSIQSTILSLRAARILNPKNLKQTGFFGQIVSKIGSDEEVVISNPNNNTNLIHIEDVVDAIDYFIYYKDKEKLPNVLNLGGENLSMDDYIKVVQDVLGKKGVVTLAEEKAVTSSSCIDTSLMQFFDFTAKHSLRDIIEQVIQK